jgi:hypothetical protein
VLRHMNVTLLPTATRSVTKSRNGGRKPAGRAPQEFPDAGAFFVTNSPGGPKLNLDERIGLHARLENFALVRHGNPTKWMARTPQRLRALTPQRTDRMKPSKCALSRAYFTARDTVPVCVMSPEVPVTVIAYEPAVVPAFPPPPPPPAPPPPSPPLPPPLQLSVPPTI